MTTEQTLEHWKKQFRSAFRSETTRQQWQDIYITLRATGDDHAAAVETIRGEMQMEQRNAFRR
jgi:hypothetical protein